MPELPDVETFRRYLDKTALNQKIKDVEIKNKKVLNVSERKLKKLKGKKFKRSYRHGKYIFVKFNDWLVMHFSMTGFLKFLKNKKQETKHARVVFKMTKGNLYYDCQRMLGKISITHSIEDFIKKKLGEDALKIKEKDFKELINNGKGKIKSFLMSQDKIAGIGNIYGDEILFQSKIFPGKKVNDLNEKEINKLYKKMKTVLKDAIKYKANPKKMPNSWLIPNREEGKKCPKCKGKIKTIKINSRTSYYCDCQK